LIPPADTSLNFDLIIMEDNKDTLECLDENCSYKSDLNNSIRNTSEDISQILITFENSPIDELKKLLSKII
jgi:hypothetical protein